MNFNRMVVELEAFSGSGGAIEPLEDKILLVSPTGRIALIDANGEGRLSGGKSSL